MLDMRAPGVGVTSELRSVVESLRAETLAELPDARVEQDFTELHEAVQALEAERQPGEDQSWYAGSHAS